MLNVGSEVRSHSYLQLVFDHVFLSFEQQEYCDSKIYPMFPRYNILKDMIKDVTHHPDYMEHRHESRY